MKLTLIPVLVLVIIVALIASKYPTPGQQVLSQVGL